MFSWKTGTLAYTLTGLQLLILPVLFYKLININQMLFGFTFLSIAIIKAKEKPSVLGGIFTMLIGLAYFMGTTTTIGLTILWPLSIVLFLGTCFVEFFMKLGPLNAKAKALIVVPMATIGFNLLLAIAGYNPLLAINWNKWMTSFGYVAVAILCWVTVFQVGGWEPFKKKTNLVINLMAISAVLLSFLAMGQGSLFQW